MPNGQEVFMKPDKYTIEVMFSMPITVTVYATDEDDAMDKAEYKASEQFRDQINAGLLGAADFYCEAQTP